MKHVVVKLTIDIELIQHQVAAVTKLAADDTDDMPEFLTGVGDMISDSLLKFELSPSRNFDNVVSQRNGGYSLYTVYNYIQDDLTVKLLLDIRLSNHDSKPDLAAFLERSEAKLQHADNLSDTDCKSLDIYCKQHKWGLQIYIGGSGDSSYNEPVTTLEAAQRIIEGKLSKFMDKYRIEVN